VAFGNNTLSNRKVTVLPSVLCPPRIGLIFHKKPGVDTGRTADPNWPNKQDIRYHVTSCSLWCGTAGWGEVVIAQEQHQAVREVLCIFPWFCVLFFSVLLLLFTSFAVLLNSPYPDPRVLAFSSDSPPQRTRRKGNRAVVWFFAGSPG